MLKFTARLVDKEASSLFITGDDVSMERFLSAVKRSVRKEFKPMASLKAIQEVGTEDQGKKHDIQGYYMPDINLTSSFMRPSKIFNDIIDSF